MSFVHIHTHSDRSIMDGKSNASDIAKRVKELGQTAFSLTDHGTTSGLFEGYKAAKEEGLKFIFGSEFYFCRNVNIKEREYYHLVLLAKDLEGYRNLLKLTTIAHSDGNFYYKPRIDFSLLKEYHKGLIATSACMGGLLKMSHMEGDEVVSEARQIAQQFKELFGEDFYIEVHTNNLKNQAEFNLEAVQIAKELNIEIVAACDSHYIYKEDASVHRAWKGIGQNDENAYYGTDDFYIMSEEEVYANLTNHGLGDGDISNSINNTCKIAEKCNVDIDFKTKHYPNFPIPAGFRNQFEYLKSICSDGWNRLILGKIPKEQLDEYHERLIYELETLQKAEYINYFLITWDVLNWCHANGIYTGVGRGSVTASLVSYLMGITKIDPVKYGLIFERFCHLERVTPPDMFYNVECYGNIAC